MTLSPRTFVHTNFPKGAITVYPKLHQGTLNYGLDVLHYHTPFDHQGVEPGHADAKAGFFPTAESVAVRERDGASARPWDLLSNIRGGMTSHIRVITLNPGHHIFRFSQHGKRGGGVQLGDTSSANSAYAPFEGPWWTSKLGFENMLGRLDAKSGNKAMGVVNGRAMGLRQYARNYSAVFTDWSKMELVGMCKVLRPIKAFMGMGAKLERSDVKVNYASFEKLETETFNDENVQLYIPNLNGQIGTSLSTPSIWSPEKVDELLSNRIQYLRRAGTTLKTRVDFIIQNLR